MTKKAQITIRSSAAEYLTYIASTGAEQENIEMRYEDENIWLSQKMMALLYDIDVRTINYHIKKIFADSELSEDSVIRKFRITASDGKSYTANHYSLQMIIAVGFKVNSERAVQFRKWVNEIATQYTIRGWVMDDERLKQGTYLTDKYFDEQLERIREIRASERKFYQKVTDLYGIHESIISEEDWLAAQKQRENTSIRQPKTHSLEHEHVLSGLLKCPICGSGMYGNVNRKKKKDGTYYKDYFYYACKHRLHVDGKRCDYHHQWGEDVIDAAVEEIIRQLVNTPTFEQGLREKIGSRLDTADLDQEIEQLRKQLRQHTGTKDRISEQMDALVFDDPHYDRKLQDLQIRQNKIYDQIASVESEIADAQIRLENIQQNKVSADNVYQFLLYFDKLYGKFSDIEKKAFMNSFIERIEIFPERQENGRILKHIEFRFPVFYEGQTLTGLDWDSNESVETVMVLSKLSDAEQYRH